MLGVGDGIGVIVVVGDGVIDDDAVGIVLALGVKDGIMLELGDEVGIGLELEVGTGVIVALTLADEVGPAMGHLSVDTSGNCLPFAQNGRYNDWNLRKRDIDMHQCPSFHLNVQCPGLSALQKRSMNGNPFGIGKKVIGIYFPLFKHSRERAQQSDASPSAWAWTGEVKVEKMRRRMHNNCRFGIKVCILEVEMVAIK